MPTGYTAAVADGTITDLPAFAMQLARGMGALITMRDAPWDAPIPERLEPSTKYHDEKLSEARKEHERIYSMKDAEAQSAADAEMAEFEANRAKAENENREQRNRYNAMIAKVVQWEGAPEGIKEFALEQLHSGRDFDCREPFRYWGDPPERNGAKWRASKLEKIARDISYHEAERAKEIARTEGRNAWLAQLRASLAQEPGNV